MSRPLLSIVATLHLLHEDDLLLHFLVILIYKKSFGQSPSYTAVFLMTWMKKYGEQRGH